MRQRLNGASNPRFYMRQITGSGFDQVHQKRMGFRTVADESPGATRGSRVGPSHPLELVAGLKVAGPGQVLVDGVDPARCSEAAP